MTTVRRAAACSPCPGRPRAFRQRAAAGVEGGRRLVEPEALRVKPHHAERSGEHGEAGDQRHRADSDPPSARHRRKRRRGDNVVADDPRCPSRGDGRRRRRRWRRVRRARRGVPKSAAGDPLASDPLLREAQVRHGGLREAPLRHAQVSPPPAARDRRAHRRGGRRRTRCGTRSRPTGATPSCTNFRASARTSW